jgi:hypothetical protein
MGWINPGWYLLKCNLPSHIEEHIPPLRQVYINVFDSVPLFKDNQRECWVDVRPEMIECKAPTIMKEYEFRDFDSEEWDCALFKGYVFDSNFGFKYMGGYTIYKQIREIGSKDNNGNDTI